MGQFMRAKDVTRPFAVYDRDDARETTLRERAERVLAIGRALDDSGIDRGTLAKPRAMRALGRCVATWADYCLDRDGRFTKRRPRVLHLWQVHGLLHRVASSAIAERGEYRCMRKANGSTKYVPTRIIP